MNVYIENLDFSSVLKTILKIRKNNDYEVFYFDASFLITLLLKLINSGINIKIEKLDFKMIDIKDDNDELIRNRIPRKDLFFIQDEIINHQAYKTLLKKNNNFEKFIQKGLIDFGIPDQASISRIIYIINVVNWHNKKNNYLNTKLIINQRPWFEIIHNYAKKFQIELTYGKKIRLPLFFKIKQKAIQFIKNNIRLFIFIENLLTQKLYYYPKIRNKKKYFLFLEGRGDLNTKNNGDHSDFFWIMNSSFPADLVLYDSKNKDEKTALNSFGISLNNRRIKYSKINQIQLENYNKFKFEKSEIERLTNEYNHLKSYWYSFFKTNYIKIFTTWYKYSRHHIAKSDAIKDCGGISTIWQMAFDGQKYIGNQTISDIVFSFSSYSATVDFNSRSEINYNIIVGYPKDYATPIVINKAYELRKKLKKAGAKKIIFSIDENSINDSRWHTGHELQRENYSYICQKVLDTPWLGVIFKPKNINNLRKRLGSVNKILIDAEKTGRCYLFEESGRHTTLAAPIQAGLASDICIHGHLDSGTAALECALAGLPTLLIDREGSPFHKLNTLPKDYIVFDNWIDALDKSLEHFKRKNGIEKFGDWSEYIDEFDPFRDGKAAERIGNYLNELIKGFHEGLDNETIMANAAERYANIWGVDKIINAIGKTHEK